MKEIPLIIVYKKEVKGVEVYGYKTTDAYDKKDSDMVDSTKDVVDQLMFELY